MPKETLNLPDTLHNWNNLRSVDTFIAPAQLNDIIELVEGVEQVVAGFREKLEKLAQQVPGGLITWVETIHELRDSTESPNASITLSGHMKYPQGNLNVHCWNDDAAQQIDFTRRIGNHDKKVVSIGASLTKGDEDAQTRLELARPWQKADYERFIEMVAGCDSSVKNIFEVVRDDIDRLLIKT